MPKGGGKGKISNDLVAASCAAVLVVYTAGYLRTRDAARKFETQAQERKLAGRTQRAVAIRPIPAVIVASAPVAVQSVPEPPLPAMTVPTPAAASTPVKRIKPVHAAVASSSSPRTAAHKIDHAKTLAATPAMRTPLPEVESLPAAGASASSPVASNAIAPVPLPSEIARASPAVASAPEPPRAPAAKWRDGTYTGLGNSPHGDIEARVVIKGGRIVEAEIATCDTRYPCDLLDPIVHQPLLLQSPNVDYIARATESSDAYYYGLTEALNKALEQPPGDAATAK